VTSLPFDPDVLRARYAQERDRRLRPDGIAQYVEVAGEFAGFAEDPWSGLPPAREPLTDEVDVAIIGAGFGGLLTGARLRELAVTRIRLIDKAADVGGTWYWNRYPGIACDVESYVYLPLLEEVGYIPTEKYAKGPEIFAHCRRIAEHYDLYRDACLHTEVREIRWDTAQSRWIVHTDRGDAIRARFISMANGYLQKPKLPGIPGISSFQGHTFHTSRWDYDYTGADLERLADKRIGVIGTGATAVQCVPHLARAAGGLSHPHIVTVFDAGISDERAYIAMELLKGRDLRQLRQEGWRATPAQAALIVRRVADALVATAETVRPGPGPTPAASAEETERILHWLDQPGVRLVSVEGTWASPARSVSVHRELFAAAAGSAVPSLQPPDADHRGLRPVR